MGWVIVAVGAVLMVGAALSIFAPTVLSRLDHEERRRLIEQDVMADKDLGAKDVLAGPARFVRVEMADGATLETFVRDLPHEHWRSVAAKALAELRKERDALKKKAEEDAGRVSRLRIQLEPRDGPVSLRGSALPSVLKPELGDDDETTVFAGPLKAS